MKTDQLHGSGTDSRWMIFGAFTAFVVTLFGIKLWLISNYGNATPWADQWDAEAGYLYKPFISGSLGWQNFVAPYHEHRILTTRLLALALLTINGIWNPLLQMVVNASLHIAALGFCIALLMRVLGRKHLPALLVFSLFTFGIPYAWENTLAGFQSPFYFVLLFSIACLWLTVTKEPLSAPWWGGIACGALAFYSLASGIFAFAASSVVGIVFYLTSLHKTVKQLAGIVILAGLFTLGAALTPSPSYHASLKTASLHQFIDAYMAVLGWPIGKTFLAALAINSPALVVVAMALWRRPEAADRKWFLVALAVWSLGQAMSIAYGRAAISLSPRYLDLFAIAILVNFACLISVAEDFAGHRRRQVVACLGLWTLLVLLSLGKGLVGPLSAQLDGKRVSGQASELNVRRYLATGDFNHLKNKPQSHVPYPKPERLTLIFFDPEVRAILPTNIRPPLMLASIEDNPVNAFVNDGYHPVTPKRSDMTIGSYGPQGDAATGQASMRFEGNKGESLVAIPIAGYPGSTGMSIELEQRGTRQPLSISRNPKESWAMVYVKLHGGPFSLHLTDSSATAWLAVGAPFVTGRLDALTDRLLANYPVFIVLGLSIGIWLMTSGGVVSYDIKSMEK